MNLKIGDVIYKYRLEKKLGQGSFGQVWLATDKTIDNQVALKILPSEFSSVAQTLEEARNGHKVCHNNLLKIYYADIVPTDNHDSAIVIIAEEYHKNGTIESRLNALNFLALPILLKTLKDILRGLEYLHNGGIIHNDIKPGNILLDQHENGILSDYGISGISVGGNSIDAKSAYILHQAPESKKDNKIDIQTDIYQWGCTAYRLANSVSDCTFSTFQPYVPKKIVSIIKKAMNPDRSKRYQSALDIRRDLEKLNFPGYWTSAADGTLIGKGRNDDYRFEDIPKANELFDFKSYKIKRDTGKTTKISLYCKTNLNKKDYVKTKNNFFEWVINNAK